MAGVRKPLTLPDVAVDRSERLIWVRERPTGSARLLYSTEASASATPQSSCRLLAMCVVVVYSPCTVGVTRSLHVLRFGSVGACAPFASQNKAHSRRPPSNT